VGQFLKTEQIIQTGASEEYSEKIEAVTAGIIEMKNVKEDWSDWGNLKFTIAADMIIDPDDVKNKLEAVINDKQKVKELEESRERTRAAETEIAKLKKEMEETKRLAAAEKDKLKREMEEEKNKVLQAAYNKQVDNLSAEEYFTRGNNADENENFTLAVEYYQKAISIDPTFIPADERLAASIQNIGTICYKQGNYTQALTHYQEAIKILTAAKNKVGIRFVSTIDDIGRENGIYNDIGLVYYKLGDYAQAIDAYKKVTIKKFRRRVDGSVYVANESLYIETSNNMGIAYSAQGNYQQAINTYQNLIDENYDIVNAYYNMGIVYEKQGNKIKKIRCFKKAAQLGHANAQERLKENGYSW
jgi:superkiller protein 3